MQRLWSLSQTTWQTATDKPQDRRYQEQKPSQKLRAWPKEEGMLHSYRPDKNLADNIRTSLSSTVMEPRLQDRRLGLHHQVIAEYHRSHPVPLNVQTPRSPVPRPLLSTTISLITDHNTYSTMAPSTILHSTTRPPCLLSTSASPHLVVLLLH